MLSVLRRYRHCARECLAVVDAYDTSSPSSSTWGSPRAQEVLASIDAGAVVMLGRQVELCLRQLLSGDL